MSTMERRHWEQTAPAYYLDRTRGLRRGVTGPVRGAELAGRYADEWRAAGWSVTVRSA
jgi:hypothetical protein